MDRRERFNNLSTAVIAALQGWQTNIWTAMPGIIQSFDPVKMTCVVQPAIMARFLTKEGNYVWRTMPLCLDCPVIFPGGGGFTLTFPIAANDECLLIYASKCIDGWWQSGGFNNQQAELRMHDLSDGFVIVGPRSQPRTLADVSTDSLELRSDDGETLIRVGPGSSIRVEADNVKVHARESYTWDAFGYGQKVTYEGGSTWQVDNYTTPGSGQTVNTNNHDINPPEAG